MITIKLYSDKSREFYRFMFRRIGVDHICCNLQVVLRTYYSIGNPRNSSAIIIYKNLYYEFKLRVVLILNPTRIRTVIHLLHDCENYETACIKLRYIWNKPALSQTQLINIFSVIR